MLKHCKTTFLWSNIGKLNSNSTEQNKIILPKCFCHESWSCSSVNSPPDVTHSPHWLLHHTAHWTALPTTHCTDTAVLTDHAHTWEPFHNHHHPITHYISQGLPQPDAEYCIAIIARLVIATLRSPYHSLALPCLSCRVWPCPCFLD